nr:bifunctional protein-serine/threonine kinase/phosphatase [uncultured Pseudogulbenkiania sp.]
MSLALTVGHATDAGPKPRNEDALACVTPEAGLLTSKGALFVLADGVSSCADGKLAAQSSVRAVAADYYATPETWEVGTALDRLLTAHNRWLRSQGKTLVATLTALVLRGRRFTVAHVGDSRLYRLTGGRLFCLTTDHVWDEPSMRHVLKRAMGLDEHVMADFLDGDVAEGDVFLLVSDGVWGPLPDKRLDEVLRLHVDPQRAAQVLVEEAIAAGSGDNLSAIVLRVDGLPSANLGDELARGAFQSLPPRLKPGQEFDGLTVEAVLNDAPSGLAYRVLDSGGKRWVMKTLPPTLAGDSQAEQALLVEEWLQKRLTAHYFAEVKPLPARQHLYYLLRWYAGENLAERRRREGGSIGPSEVVKIGLRLTRALAALHRLNIVHRDVKPENIHIDHDDKLRLLDLGVAYCPGLTVDRDGAVPGTPSYMAPELFEGASANVRTDLYAAGVTLYWLLTGHYPYGEVEPFQHPRFGTPELPTRYRPDLPLWLENVLLKAVERDPARRFETAEELQLALEKGDAQPVSVRRRVPWAERAPLKLWRAIALVSLLLNLVLVYLLLVW